MKPDRKLLENVAAITAGFYEDRRKYNRFYQQYGERLGGFPAIWNYCIEAAEAFTQAETAKRWVAGIDYEWIEAISSYVARIYSSALSGHHYIPTGSELVRIAREAIEAYSTAPEPEAKRG